ncbi:hypothetical protein Tco_1049101 [Tanacetum coccineum]
MESPTSIMEETRYMDSAINIQKQATVALSSCELEFIAVTAAATQALWLKRLLNKLTHSQEEKITIQVDNKSVIALMKNPVFHGRSKHIDTKYHFIRECVEREDIQVELGALYGELNTCKAHVRGHQARKNYKAICWAVSIVEKIILRWHRKRVGLRGFYLDSIDESADEDIAKVFRKKRVDVALAEAVSRVLSMVNSTPARTTLKSTWLLHYLNLNILELLQAEQGGWENERGTSQLDAAAGMETEEFFDFV